MDDEYNDSQDSVNDNNRNNSDGNESGGDGSKEFPDYEENFDDEDGGNNRNGRGNRNNFRGRGRGPPPGWMNGPPPMRFRGRGYGPGGPPMRGRGFFRGRGGPRGFGPNNGPNFDGNWGPMGPPPGMMGGPPPFGPPPGMMGPGGPMGPPPNMMGQPPPFGAPPGMPPPNMQAPEIWVETKSEDGKSYYYHSRTRETTWTRPQDSPTCKVITQAEMEAMATTGQLPGMGAQQTMGAPQGMAQTMGAPPQGMGAPPQGMGAPQGMPMNGPGGPMTHMQPPMGMVPPGVGPPTSQAGQFMQPPPWAAKPDGDKEIPSLFSKEAMPPFMQPPPWANMDGPPGQSKEGESQDAASPSDNDDAPPGEALPPPQATQPPPNGFPGAPAAMPWSGWGGAGWPPPLSGQPPPLLQTPQQGNQLQQNPLIPQAGQPPQLIPTSQPLGIPTSQPLGVPTSQPMGIPTSQPLGNMGMPPSLGISVSQPLGIPGTQPLLMPGQTPQMGMPHPMNPMGGEMPPGEEQSDEMRIPPELAAAAAEWTTHRAPDGRDYYYHARRHESVWVKPQPLVDLEEFQKRAAEKQAENKQQQQESAPEKMDVSEPNKSEVVDVEAHAEAAAQASRSRIERQQADERQRQEKEKQEKEEKEKANSKPMWSTHIVGTPWRVVWTAEGRVFFFNPSIPKSVWARPAELVGREDVDKTISQPPKAVLKLQQANNTAPPAAAKSPANGDLKRTVESDSDESEEEPVKKQQKVEEVKKAAATSTTSIDANKEAAIEAEVRAARERAVVPLEQRMKTFRQMLLENEVSAFSTWKKELHKIVFDKRYLLLTSDQRKQVFSKYVRERAEEERKEKMNRIQQKKNAFVALMEEAKLHSKSSYLDFSSKYGKDDRFKGIDKPRNREQYFTEYLADLKKKEKEEREKKREQVKQDFVALLREKGIDRHARWPDVKKRLEGDARYRAVDSSSVREDYFRDYTRALKDERRKDKDRDRDRSSSKKEKKDKERDKDRDKDKERDKDKDRKEKKSKRDKEKGSDNTKSTNDDEQPTSTTDEKVTETIDLSDRDDEASVTVIPDVTPSDKEDDAVVVESTSKSAKSPVKSPVKSPKRKRDASPRRKREERSERKRDRDRRGEDRKRKVSEKDLDTSADAEPGAASPEPEAEAEAEADGAESDTSEARAKAARAQQSLKEREREVQKALATSLRDRDKEREYHKRDEAVQHFNALLADLVRNPELSWREAKKQLKKDHRYSLAELLSKDDKERLFTTHTHALGNKRRDKFRALLTELNVAPTASWRETRALLKHEPRAQAYPDPDKMEREFRDYQRDRQTAAKTALRQLLLETRGITHKTLRAVQAAGGAGAAHNLLKHDARYLALEHVPEERDAIIMSYLEELDKKGPPPPPTASEPSRRSKQ
ncbi:transcription elongation regulator 1-like [Plutella xylostella]|uniref:transcription elongation regulator 1-like n=1 Tax=Plutella xylostella TaxID=51655 RepID=UPI00203264BE|nr:transcription elongation regulator 1-like [Plutella xylostella]